MMEVEPVATTVNSIAFSYPLRFSNEDIFSVNRKVISKATKLIANVKSKDAHNADLLAIDPSFTLLKTNWKEPNVNRYSKNADIVRSREKEPYRSFLSNFTI